MSSIVVTLPRISSQSRVIRKKTATIHDVSSFSSPTPAIGKMRSDLISVKTTIVGKNSPKKTPVSSMAFRRRETTSQSPNFRVRLNVRPQLVYNKFLDKNDDEDALEESVSPLASKPSRIISMSEGRRRREGAVTVPRISSQSRVIRKKPATIHDVSSSSPTPAIGKMRSDLISVKTTVVGKNSPKKVPVKAMVSHRREATSQSPNFRVRLNVRPQVVYNTFLDENDDEDAVEQPASSLAPKSSRIISMSDGRREGGRVGRGFLRNQKI